MFFRAGGAIMARKPSVWFREQTGWYTTTIGGEQVKLSKDKKEAETAFHELLAGRTREEGEGPRPSLKVIVGSASANPVDLIDKTFALAQECGGMDQLRRLVEWLSGA
jgi:hypothetical protein